MDAKSKNIYAIEAIQFLQKTCSENHIFLKGFKFDGSLSKEIDSSNGEKPTGDVYIEVEATLLVSLPIVSVPSPNVSAR